MTGLYNACNLKDRYQGNSAKIKVVPVHAIKVYRGNGGIAPSFLNFGHRRFTPRRKRSQSKLNRRLGAPPPENQIPGHLEHISPTSDGQVVQYNAARATFLVYAFTVKLTHQFRLCRSQWPRGLRRTSTAVRLLGLWVRIPPEAWMDVCCECCVLLSCRGLCDDLAT